jgi:hypothetical protein
MMLGVASAVEDAVVSPDFASLKAETLHMKEEMARESAAIDAKLKEIVDRKNPESLIQVNSPEQLEKMLREFREKSGALLEKNNNKVRKTRREYENSMEKLRSDIVALRASRKSKKHSSLIQTAESPPDVEAWYQDLKRQVIPAGQIPPYSLIEIGTPPLDVDALYATQRAEVEHDHPALDELRGGRPKKSPKINSLLQLGNRLAPLDVEALYAIERDQVERVGRPRTVPSNAPKGSG